jgi:hypothetical protein
MSWKKKGLLFPVADYTSETINKYAAIPFALHMYGDKYRFFFSCRNEKSQSIPYFIDAEVAHGNINLIGNVSKPILSLGKLGTFDDSGIMPCSLIRHNGKIYMYYIGWNPQVSVSYRLSIGLAISEDNGETFMRYSDAPICDRSLEEPFFNTAPFVIFDKGIWKMWYISCTGWSIIHNYPEPSYHVKYAESADGIHWRREGKICLDYDDFSKAIGRPCVLPLNDKFIMYFSYRDIVDYRTVKGKGYQIGLATSKNGIDWVKKYDEAGIQLSESGWDSQMMEYCHVFHHEDFYYMLYNGNTFGLDGFGYAVSNKIYLE